MARKLRPVRCKRCDRLFYLCRSCDRGQSYCSDACRKASRQRTVRRARRKYARSEKGKRNNRERQRRFRKRKSLKLRSLNKGVTDPSSQGVLAVVSFRHRAVGIASRKESVSGVRDVYRIWQKRRRRREPGPNHRAVHAWCHVCGRPGIVFREKRRRGRFRWIHL
jgi:hypothetical protein